MRGDESRTDGAGARMAHLGDLVALQEEALQLRQAVQPQARDVADVVVPELQNLQVRQHGLVRRVHLSSHHLHRQPSQCLLVQ